MFRSFSRRKSSTGQGGEVHVHPANAAAVLFRTVNRINGFQYIINAASGIRLASHHEYALMPLPQQDLCFLPDLIRIQCPGRITSLLDRRNAQYRHSLEQRLESTEEQKGQSGFRRSLPSRIWPYETVRPVNPVSERAMRTATSSSESPDNERALSSTSRTCCRSSA